MFNRGFKSWCEQVALQQRRALGVRPVDPLSPEHLAARLNIQVRTPGDVPDLDPDCVRTLVHEDPDSWSAVTISEDSRSVIILNSAHSKGRTASDLMHELAHILVGHKPARVDVAEDGSLLLHLYDKKQEDEATWLAGCLLLPRVALVEILASRIERQVAARRYGVSMDMLTYRIGVTGVEYQLGRRSRRN